MRPDERRAQRLGTGLARARDDATLLVDWLNELLGRSEVTGRAYDEVRGLRVGEGILAGEVRGRLVRQWRSALKAATYHGLELARDGTRVNAVVLFDVAQRASLAKVRRKRGISVTRRGPAFFRAVVMQDDPSQSGPA